MMFPPNYLHTRLSAHFIEINSIYFNEMIKHYMVARKDILAERQRCTPEERMTRYIANPNYVYEPLKSEGQAIVELHATGEF